MVWGAGKGEGGTLGVEMFTRAATLLQVAQSWVAARLPQEGLGDHTPHGCPCLFVPLCLPQPQTGFKTVLSPLQTNGTDREKA